MALHFRTSSHVDSRFFDDVPGLSLRLRLVSGIGQGIRDVGTQKSKLRSSRWQDTIDIRLFDSSHATSLSDNLQLQALL